MSCSQFQQYTEAGLKCAAAYNHCASSCQKKEEIQIMTRPAQPDTGTAFRHDAAARLMSPGKKETAVCAEGAARYADDHSRMYAETCRQCGEECRKMNNCR